MIEISLWLYGNPGWDLQLEGLEEFDSNILREHGLFMKKHLNKVASIIDKLQDNGWKVCGRFGPVYSVSFYKNGIKSREEVKEDLKRLGIDPEDVAIFEIEDR